VTEQPNAEGWDWTQGEGSIIDVDCVTVAVRFLAGQVREITEGDIVELAERLREVLTNFLNGHDGEHIDAAPPAVKRLVAAMYPLMAP
jgi:DNA/RNA-binding domain of Phe-tRNA-synthetase-like protein